MNQCSRKTKIQPLTLASRIEKKPSKYERKPRKFRENKKESLLRKTTTILNDRNELNNALFILDSNSFTRILHTCLQLSFPSRAIKYHTNSLHQDYPFPNDLGPDSVRENLESSLQQIGFSGKLLIKAYVDEKNFPDHEVQNYEEAGITIVRRQGVESARNYSLVVDIALWALENPTNYYKPLNLMVISKKIKDNTYFLSVLEALKDRYYNILLALPHCLSSSGLDTVSFEWLSSRLVNGVNPINQSRAFQEFCHKHKRADKIVTFRELLQESEAEKIVTFSELLPCTVESMSTSDIPVFWDVGFPSSSSFVKEGLDGFDEFRTKALIPEGYRGTLLINAYVEKEHNEKKKYPMCGGYRVLDPEWKTTYVPKGDKYAKVTRMLLDVLFWAMNNSPGILILLSEDLTDTNCSCVIEALKAKRFNVILATSITQLTSDNLVCCHGSIEEPVSMENPLLNAFGFVILLDAEDWKGIKPQVLYRILQAALYMKGYYYPAEIVVYSGARFDEVYPPGKFNSGFVDDYTAAGFRVRHVGPIPKAPLMIADSILRSNRRSTFMIISKPFNDKISYDVYAGVVKELKKRDLRIFFALPDMFWVTVGSSEWSLKTFVDFYECCDDMEIEG